MDNLLKKLNEVNRYSTASNISIGNLSTDEKYKVERLEKVETKFGGTIGAYITKGGDELWRIYLPKKFVNMFDEQFIERFNARELGDLFLTYKGLSQKSFNIIFHNV